MHRILTVCLVCVLAEGCGSVNGVVTDCYSVWRAKRISQPAVDLFVMNVRSPDGSRIDLYAQMPYDRLRFVRSTAGFDVSYSVSFVFRDEKGDVVQSRDVTRRVTVGSYEATVSQHADAFLQTVILPPGTYELTCTCVDQNSLIRYTQKSGVRAMNFATDSAMASGMLFVMKPKNGDERTVLHPLFPQTLWRARDSMGIYQEVYGVRVGDTITVHMEYLAPPSGAREASRTKRTMSPPFTRYVAPCERTVDSSVYPADFVHGARRSGTIHLLQFYPAPPAGYGEIERTVSVRRGNKTDSFISRLTVFRSLTRGLTLADVVDAMRLIMREDEYDSLRVSADTLRAAVIERFWADHGGPPRRTEFEARVDEANKLFSVCIEGSRTPMGIAYIVCGPPEYIDCRSPNRESWFYAIGSETMEVPFYLEPRNVDTAYYELAFNSVNESLWRICIDRWRRE